MYSIYNGVDFVGLRIFPKYRLLRKRNIRKMKSKVENFKTNNISFSKIYEIYHGWSAYSKWANSYKEKEKIRERIIDILWKNLNL